MKIPRRSGNGGGDGGGMPIRSVVFSRNTKTDGKFGSIFGNGKMGFCALKDCLADPICHKAQSAEHAAKAAKAARLVW